MIECTDSVLRYSLAAPFVYKDNIKIVKKLQMCACNRKS